MEWVVGKRSNKPKKSSGPHLVRTKTGTKIQTIPSKKNVAVEGGVKAGLESDELEKSAKKEACFALLKEMVEDGGMDDEFMKEVMKIVKPGEKTEGTEVGTKKAGEAEEVLKHTCGKS